MANTEITQRNLYQRVELSVPTTGVTVKRRRGLVITTALLCMVLAALLYALVEGIDGWAHFVVLGGIVSTVIGTMLAIEPLRRG